MPKKVRLLTWEELMDIEDKYPFSAGNPGPGRPPRAIRKKSRAKTTISRKRIPARRAA